MANVKISGLPVASTPLSGTEIIPLVQNGVTSQTTIQSIVDKSSSGGGAGGTSLITRPLVGMIAHSYGNNTCSQSHILSYQITDSNGTVAFTAFTNIQVSTPSDYVRIWGLGAPYDGIFAVTSAAQTSAPWVFTVYNPNAVGSPQPAPLTVSPLGKAYIGAAGSSGTGAGLIPNGGISWANAYLGHAFDLLPNYIYNVSGGKIVPTDTRDPGFVQQCTNLTNKGTTLPKYVFIDHGVNDANGNAVFSTVQAAVVQGLAILKNSGIIPIWLVPRPFPNSGATTPGKWDASFTAWLKTYMPKVGGICIDTNQLLVDPTSNIGAWIDGTSADNIHLSNNGGIRDGRIIAQQLYPIFRPSSGVMPTAVDQYSSTTPLGNLLPSPVAGFPGGSFPSTVASTNIPKTNTPTQIGTVYVQAYSATNSGTRTISAEVSARTDTTADGTTIPGNELKITFGLGSGTNNCIIQFSSLAASYFYLTATNSSSETSLLAIGDQYQMEMEIYIPSSSTEDSVLYDVPRIYTMQNLQYASAQFRNTYYGTFSNGSGGLFNKTYPGGVSANIGSDIRLAGIQENGNYKPSAIISTPPMKWVGNYDGSNTNIMFRPLVQLGITSGTNSTNPFVVYIRGISLRKIDATYSAYTFN